MGLEAHARNHRCADALVPFSLTPVLAGVCVPQYMHYTRPANMTQTMLDGANRQPALPTSEAEGGTDTATTPAGAQAQQQHPLPSPRVPGSTGAASCSSVEEPEGDTSANRVGVIADSAPCGLGALVGSLSKRSLGHLPGSRGRGLSAPGPYDTEADEAQRLAQRALRTLQSQKASLQERGSWPGGEEGGVVSRCGLLLTAAAAGRECA